jgi:TolA-binding protein
MQERSNRAQTNVRKLNSLLAGAALMLCAFIAGCATLEQQPPAIDSATGNSILPSKFDQALKENQRALAEGKGPPDVALFNIGIVSAHSANPKKDYSRALLAFRTLVKDYPSSARAEQAKIWIQALELSQKNAEETQKLAEEKRAVARERDLVSQERSKLNYAIEKSRQLDAEIEKRRRQSLNR